MGFLRNRKNKKSDEDQEIRETEVAEASENDQVEDIAEEEDDFAPVEESNKPSREEFKQAAVENIAAAAEGKKEEEASEDNNKAEEQPDKSEEQSVVEDEEISEDDQTDEPEEFGDDYMDDFDSEEAVEDAGSDQDSFVQEEEQPKERKQFKLGESGKKALKGIGIGAGVLVGICLCIYIYGCATVPKDKIMKRVYIEDVNVSGLSRDEAIAKLQNANLLGEQTITLKCDGQTFSINGTDVGMVAKIEETVDKAMLYGKTGNFIVDGFANTLQIFANHKVVPDANVDEAILREKIAEFGKQVHGELVEHSLEFGDGVVIASPGRTGFDNNTDIAYQEVLDAIENEQFNDINVTLNTGGPQPLTVERVDGFTYCDPIDAYFDISNNEVMIIKEVPGRYINKDEVAQLVTQVYEGGPNVNIPYYVSNPSVTAEQLQAKLFNATIASYSTNYASSNSNRRANIAQAASKINGKILAPGEVFSFNDTVGPRSVANGFYTAKEYVNGETVDGIGGGTCQVSSTLYNAVLYSDLSIVSRTNHMFPVSYCPIGQDATVADTGVDFKFLNSMDYPIKISAVTSGATITISIIGTQRDDPRTVKITNTSKAVGADTSVHSVRYVYNSAGELIQTDDLGNSYYLSH